MDDLSIDFTNDKFENQRMIDDLARKLSGGKTLEDLKNIQTRNTEKLIEKLELKAESNEAVQRYFEKLKSGNFVVPQTEFKSMPYDETRQRLWQLIKPKNWVINDLNRDVFIYLISWLSGNSIAQDSNIVLDAKKGIFLCGGTGNGKTSTMKIIQKFCLDNPEYRFRHFKMKPMSEILDDMANGIQPKLEGNWCIDDIGVNYFEVAKVYGNTFHPLPYLIDKLYLNFKNGFLLHVTSNETPKEIMYKNPNAPRSEWVFKDGFDERIRSRIFEMFNVIINTDVDRRFEK